MATEQPKDAILVVNSGSSSLKVGLFVPEAGERPLYEGSADGIGQDGGSIVVKSASGDAVLQREHTSESQAEALAALVEALRVALNEQVTAWPVAVGHRIVHGGPGMLEHQLITPAVLRQLDAAVHFAPLHLPPALALVRQAQKLFPDCPHYACFDDAFHRTMPEVARHLPLPQKYFEQGVVRYGFHGLSCESIVQELGPALPKRSVIAHLGSGSSVTALRDGKSIDTSMGLTPTGGIPMATRSGDLDPGVLLYLLRTGPMAVDELESLLNHECGLAGFSGGEADMQKLLQRAGQGEQAASLAVEAFSTAVRKCVGAYAALMGGIDLLIFTGGIGEHSAEIRGRVCEGLEFLGIRAEPAAKVAVIKTQEERQIARHCRTLLSS